LFQEHTYETCLISQEMSVLMNSGRSGCFRRRARRRRGLSWHI